MKAICEGCGSEKRLEKVCQKCEVIRPKDELDERHDWLVLKASENNESTWAMVCLRCESEMPLPDKFPADALTHFVQGFTICHRDC